jgi:hypothetical protein
MATILELAQLSDAAYGDQSALTYLKQNGWTLFSTSLANPDGYLGEAYKKTNPNGTVQIVIANRGTRGFSSLADLLNDAKLTAGKKNPAQDDAAIFAQSVVDRANGQALQASFIETGHSLGGNEAQAAVVALTSAGVSVWKTGDRPRFPSGKAGRSTQ